MFRDDFGLINSLPGRKNEENALLWTVEHYFLTKSEDDETVLKLAMYLCKIKTGIYEQHPCKSFTGDERYMSHDQLTAIAVSSYYFEQSHHLDIWNEIKRQGFRYNNVTPETPGNRYLHPRDIIFYGYLAGSIVCKLLLPILAIILIYSCLSRYKDKEKTMLATDGKLLSFIRCQGTKDKSAFFKVLYKLLTLIVNMQFGSWKGVFEYYFKHPNHPNRLNPLE